MGSMEFNQKLILERAEKIKEQKRLQNSPIESTENGEIKDLLHKILDRLDHIEQSPVSVIQPTSVTAKLKSLIKDKPEKTFIPTIDDSGMTVQAEKPEVKKSKKNVAHIADSVSKLHKISGDKK